MYNKLALSFKLKTTVYSVLYLPISWMCLDNVDFIIIVSVRIKVKTLFSKVKCYLNKTGIWYESLYCAQQYLQS
jgi:hypothetical protein